MQLKEIKKIKDEFNFDFKKKFGQNFIIDENIINGIISKADIDKDTLVIEIGPGAGSLTTALVKKAGYVLCYEVDKTLKPILDKVLENNDNVSIIFEDFLKANVNEKIKEFNYNKIYVVANLPYYITTPIIMKFIENKIDVDKIIIMVQKEVGDRFKAKEGSKDYNSLSIFLNYYFDIKKIMDVSRHVFMPKPNVDSIVIEMDKKTSKYNVINEEKFFELIKKSFTQKRKTLRNNLKDYDLDKVSLILEKNGFSLQSRAEQIPIDVFIEISNNL